MSERKNDLCRKVREFILAQQMILPGERIAAGVSGGADSVCLLLVLNALKKDLGFDLTAVHVHHGLRESADADEQYVRELCRELEVPLCVRRVQADDYARAHHIGVEEAGRILRYQFFEESLAQMAQDGDLYAGSRSSGRIATAHHMDDQAETVLFHLCRGSGLKGMAGILPVKGNRIRPLLSCTREEIEEYLHSQGRTWCTDETNMDTAYARNRLRREILPLLNSSINAGTSRHIAALAEEIAWTQEYLDEETDRYYRLCVRSDAETITADLDKLYGIPLLMRKRVLYRCICESTAHEKDISRIHVEEVLALTEKTDGTRSLSLPYGRRVFCHAGKLYFTREEKILQAAFPYPLRDSDYKARVFAFDGDLTRVPRGEYQKWFDYDKMNRFPVLRTRQPGDRIETGAGVIKKAARCMIDRKVPAPLRDRIVLAALGDQVLWIPGGEIHRGFLVTEKTRRVLELTIAQCTSGPEEGDKENGSNNQTDDQ